MAFRDRIPKRKRIDRQLLGRPIAFGERTIQPVTRLVGWYASSQGDGWDYAGAWLRLSPLEVVVREKDGRHYRIKAGATTGQAMRGLLLLAALVGGLCWLATVLINARRRKEVAEEDQT